MAKYDEMSFGKAFAAARKEKGAGSTFTYKGKSYTTNYKEEQGSAKPKGKTDIAKMAGDAIDRSGPTRPRSRPTGETGTRPRSRPTDKAPTATSITTPEVTTEKLPARSANTATRPSGPKGSSPLAPSETAGPRGTKPFAGTKPTREEWDNMSVPQRIRWGVIAPPKAEGEKGSNSGTTAARRDRRNMAMGGMVNKPNYAKGGMVKANCGASMKPSQKGTRGK